MSFNKRKLLKRAAFMIYILLLGLAVFRHEPWFDEAQAWLLARDSTPLELLTRYMRYEGSPGLWHLILMIPAKLQLPYYFLNIVSALFASAGIYVFLHYSPFPTIVKLLYPFSFFAFYQYAVVARSYTLIPLILFLIAIIYDKKKDKPFLFVFLIILLSNVSIHGTIIAFGLITVQLIEIIRIWSSLGSDKKINHIISFASFGIVLLLLYLQLKPPPDILTIADFRIKTGNFYTTSLSVLSDSLATNFCIPATKNSFFYSLSGFISSAGIIISFLWFFIRRRFLTFIIPFIGLGLLFTSVYANAWHQGTVFYLWFFVLWISYDNSTTEDPFPVKTIKSLTIILIVMVLSIQIYWSYNSFIFDRKHNYSASREAANFIKYNRLENKKIYISGFHTISILPYFSDNIFCNFNNQKKPCFWLWSGKNSIYSEGYLDTGKYDPDIIILGIKNYSDKIAGIENTWLPEIPGYKLLKLFSGNLYWKDKPFEKDSFAIYSK